MTDTLISKSGFGYAKAPIFGEYAVMHGAEALVVALTPSLSVSLSNIRPFAGTADPHTSLSYTPDVTEKLETLLHSPIGFLPVCEDIGNFSLAADIQIDDRSFFDDSGEKLGIGSSAAATVGLISAQIQAVREIRGIRISPDDALKAAIHTHRAIQNQMGSGADVIASALGGALLVQSCPANPIIRRIDSSLLPPFALLVTHQQAPTSPFIHAAKQVSDSERYKQIIREITGVCREASQSLINRNTLDFLELMASFPTMLQSLGECIQMPVVPPVFHALVPIAQKYHVILKTSGAGGGDIFIAFAQHPDHIDAFVRNIPAEFHISRLHADIASVRQFP